MNAKPVYVCAECYDLDCQIHHNSTREFECQICIDTYPTAAEAERCCSHLVDNSKLDNRHYAKEPKKAREPKMEYPTALLKGIR